MNKASYISKKAKIGKAVSIGPFTVVHDNVVIGDHTIVESHCILGYPCPGANGKPLVIRNHSHIRSHNIFYEGSSFGAHLVTGHSVLVRENCTAGKWVLIGGFTDIQGSCVIGDYVKIHSDVHISTHSKIGDFVWLYPGVQFTNDPFPPSEIREGVIVKEMAVIATGTILLPGVTIGIGGFVAAGSLVRMSVPDGHCVAGHPATSFTTIGQFFNYKHNLSYPWTKQCRMRYPQESHAQMDALVEKLHALVAKNQKKKKLFSGRYRPVHRDLSWTSDQTRLNI